MAAARDPPWCPLGPSMPRVPVPAVTPFAAGELEQIHWVKNRFESL